MAALGILGLVLRAVEALWALLATALVAALLRTVGGWEVEDTAHVAATLDFALFVAVFSWVAVLYGLASRFAPAVHRPLVVALLDGLTTLFSFSSGVVSAYRLGVRDCGQLSVIPEFAHACRMGEAGTAFMWFLSVTFAVTTFLAIKEYRGSSGRKGSSVVWVGA